MDPALRWEAKGGAVDSELLSSRANRSLALGLEKTVSLAPVPRGGSLVRNGDHGD